MLRSYLNLAPDSPFVWTCVAVFSFQIKIEAASKSLTCSVFAHARKSKPTPTECRTICYTHSLPSRRPRTSVFEQCHSLPSFNHPSPPKKIISFLLMPRIVLIIWGCWMSLRSLSRLVAVRRKTSAYQFLEKAEHPGSTDEAFA
jgi:hypothetical protein